MFPAKTSTIEKLKQPTWTEEEDERLRILIILKREKNWERIAKELVGKTPSQCKQRWKTCLSPSIIKITERRKWVPEEDEKLSKLVAKYGTKNWRIIASHLRGRLPKQCRERWINHLDPSIVKGRLTEKEWKVVLDAHEELGNRWSEIAKLIPGRTPNQIKNHWHAMLRKTNKRKQREYSNDGDDPMSCSMENGEEKSNSNEDQTPESPQSPQSPMNMEKPKYIEDEEELHPKKKFKRNDYQPVGSKLEALVKIAEFMYQFEVKPSTNDHVKSNPSMLLSLLSSKAPSTQQPRRSNGIDECSPQKVLNINSISDTSIISQSNQIQIQELVQGISSKQMPTTSLSSPRRVSSFSPTSIHNIIQSNQFYDPFGSSAFTKLKDESNIVQDKLHVPYGVKVHKNPFQSIWNSN